MRPLRRVQRLFLLPLVLLCTGAPAEENGGVEKESTAVKRAEEHYNLAKDGLALQGYDPVSYFKEGGGEPLEGKESLKVTVGKSTYYFASEKHKELFEKNPARYEPAYGGWCAYAMGAKGEKVEVNPRAFTITGGRLCLFYKTLITDTRKPWNKEVQTLKPKADQSWETLTGEKTKPVEKEDASAP